MAQRHESQKAAIKRHLEEKGPISPLEALAVYGINRLAARINDLRNSGVSIITEMKVDQRGKRYARYSLD